MIQGFAALYRGYPPTLLRAIAMNVGMMTTYDQVATSLCATTLPRAVPHGGRARGGGGSLLRIPVLSAIGAASGSRARLGDVPPRRPPPQVKELAIKYNGDNFGSQLMSSAAAGFFCAYLSLPFDMMKTRLQNMKSDPITGSAGGGWNWP